MMGTDDLILVLELYKHKYEQGEREQRYRG